MLLNDDLVPAEVGSLRQSLNGAKIVEDGVRAAHFDGLIVEPQKASL